MGRKGGFEHEASLREWQRSGKGLDSLPYARPAADAAEAEARKAEIMEVIQSKTPSIGEHHPMLWRRPGGDGRRDHNTCDLAC